MPELEDFMINIHKLLIFSYLLLLPLYGEIERVEIFWGQGSCKENCAKQLKVKLDDLPESESAVISIVSNMASLKWNQNEPFSYDAVKKPFQQMGIGIDHIRVAVRGKLTASQQKFYLISEGDNTRFDLVSHEKGKPNAKYLSLDPSYTKTFLNYTKEHQILVIEGTLYQPHRSPPLYLLVERVSKE